MSLKEKDKEKRKSSKILEYRKEMCLAHIVILLFFFIVFVFQIIINICFIFFNFFQCVCLLSENSVHCGFLF